MAANSFQWSDGSACERYQSATETNSIGAGNGGDNECHTSCVGLYPPRQFTDHNLCVSDVMPSGSVINQPCWRYFDSGDYFWSNPIDLRAGDQIDLRPSDFRRPSQAEAPPLPLPSPREYDAGFSHVFAWVQALNTCRGQIADGISRPIAPRESEFISPEDWAKQEDLYVSCSSSWQQEVINHQQRIEPVIEQADFYVVLPADDIGQYHPINEEMGCFFPGATARIELDHYKSRDAVYLDGNKFRLIPRSGTGKDAFQIEGSQTIASIELDPDSDRTVLVMRSHPICVPPDVGEVYREQKRRNGESDYGILAQLKIRFDLPSYESGHPVWQIDGEFFYRDPVEGAIVLNTDANAQPTDDAATPTEDALPIDDRGTLGCAQTSSGAGCAWLLGLLFATRRRRQHHR